MDYPKGAQGSFSSQYLPGRRTREERRSLSETLADGTSKFFSSMVAKKNGLFTDISNKIETTFSPRTDTVSNSTGSDVSVSPPTTPPGFEKNPPSQKMKTKKTPPPLKTTSPTNIQTTTAHHNIANNTASPNTPPPRPPPPKRLPSLGSSQERTTTVIKRMSSMPAYSRTDSDHHMPIPPTGRGGPSYKDDHSHHPNNKYNIGGMNVSFDQPIYGQQQQQNQPTDSYDKEKATLTDTNKTLPGSSAPTARSTITASKSETEESEKTNNRTNNRLKQQPALPASSTTQYTHSTDTRDQSEAYPAPTSTKSPQPIPAPRGGSNKSPGTTTTTNTPKRPQSPTKRDPRSQPTDQPAIDKSLAKARQNKSSSSGEEWSDRRQTSEDSNRSYGGKDNYYSDSSSGNYNNNNNDNYGGVGSGGSGGAGKKNPKLTSARRSSTVDEMLFDDYVDPEIDAVLPPADTPPENLICFEAEPEEVMHSDSSSGGSPVGYGTGRSGNGGEGGRGMMMGGGGRSVDSSDVEYGGVVMVARSGSMGSDKSWTSSYSLDSQPDDLTLDCMEFMKSFVDKVFMDGEEISQTEKAKFGELCQCFPGRLWFSRYVNSQRVHNKCVTEPIFFRLMQYFAVCLFECNEAEDYSPAKTLMNMCFTFFYQAPSMNGSHSPTTAGIGNGQNDKIFLYTYMRQQPIWQSLRFWNAAFFDAVQCERSRKPMPTSSAENQTVTDDKHFQENITFGQLGTFACNMRSFGLSKELCLEFLRKQSTIANLRKDQVKLLRDNIERVREN